MTTKEQVQQAADEVRMAMQVRRSAKQAYEIATSEVEVASQRFPDH